MKLSFPSLLRAALLCFAISTAAHAQTGATTGPSAPATGDSVLDRHAREVSSVLRCPVCQGLSIQDSPSELSQEMKNIVREQLQAGKSPDEVKAYFVSKYGEWILLEPKPRGMNLLVYMAPFILLLGGHVEPDALGTLADLEDADVLN